jgi:hypothetical protein
VIREAYLETSAAQDKNLMYEEGSRHPWETRNRSTLKPQAPPNAALPSIKTLFRTIRHPNSSRQKIFNVFPKKEISSLFNHSQ